MVNFKIKYLIYYSHGEFSCVYKVKLHSNLNFYSKSRIINTLIVFKVTNLYASVTMLQLKQNYTSSCNYRKFANLALQHHFPSPHKFILDSRAESIWQLHDVAY